MRKYITKHEWTVFFGALSDCHHAARNKAMFHMAYIHGLRVSELTGMKITDLDLIGKTVYIRRLKNGLSTVHPLQEESVVLIKEWLNIRNTHVKESTADCLFLTNQGKMISRQWIYKLCKKISLRAGLGMNIHPHMFRHACGYALANQGMDTRLIQDYLGHRNIHHTVRYTAGNAARFRRVWQEANTVCDS
ncbi:TPA: tyrosine-type recombinase/integrase [Salmonella enterica]|uniref:Tyrosine-type recombinase/integrase n=1 Tax=Salmonella enterica TaxID=28901 RepID=A0A762AAD7_SALER|nr:tyrosine-type recombinase/integrase [Salmonella enterica subsp. enterica serovar Pomona]HAF2158298.1 tyrosine-type recombinase/integrase [Salmonella enterica]HAF2414158.1 tyrosine-type recombinase/integrase [Salmonella enterica]HAF4921606.1 tyrosine-type recombinase/integrase [Salmonella enterica]HAF5915983.1 tyrosine-type recombinase/integrase [Salmonella enterica]